MGVQSVQLLKKRGCSRGRACPYDETIIYISVMIENISRVSAENMLRQNKDEKICDFTSTGNSCSEAYELPKNFCVKEAIIPIEDNPQSGDNEICILAAT
jgi:hypothetical protein